MRRELRGAAHVEVGDHGPRCVAARDGDAEPGNGVAAAISRAVAVGGRKRRRDGEGDGEGCEEYEEATPCRHSKHQLVKLLLCAVVMSGVVYLGPAHQLRPPIYILSKICTFTMYTSNHFDVLQQVRLDNSDKYCIENFGGASFLKKESKF